jgi:hypothetical protein
MPSGNRTTRAGGASPADHETAHLRADRLDRAGTVEPEARRQRDLVGAAPDQDVAIVNRDRGVADADFARPGIARLDVLEAQHLGSAGGVEADGFGHGRHANSEWRTAIS